MPRLTVIVASTRPGRVGRRIGDWFTTLATAYDAFDDVHLVDLAEVGLPFHDEPHHPSEGRYLHRHTREWSATVAASDAFVLVMPEYNYGFSAPLKNAIDYLYTEWQYKPVGFVSYGMTSGGLRAVQMIKQVVTTLKMMPANEAVTVFLRQALDDTGELVPDPGRDAAATVLLDELARLTAALAPLRVTA
ncbi:NAD(P)H-dependent oxidoreductase [Micromonospora sp. DSM 115977]|uniref:NAD(P)H-dependent oxidoreductase n=1 Tax=Micromonospora reichwaldensis TaxID=3075516 RepID=A0ABU2X2C3_9ACTN|nr:NAD(P)H-dependent oxidoreductase [Micromonospora sp. DSM 115977]MDT0531920.1 NAD(P)H-dependent oxidoreductase [Micromonospora sp. DSM 115977]